jgi:hypothetical protein
VCHAAAAQLSTRVLSSVDYVDTGQLMTSGFHAIPLLENMGDLYAKRAESAKAPAIYARALSGLTSVLGASSERCMGLSAKIDALPSASGERDGQPKLVTVEERPVPQHDRAKKGSKLSIRRLVRNMF